MAGQSRKQQIEAMLEGDPADAFLRYALAMELVSAGDDAAAVAQFQRLLTDDPSYTAGYFQCGVTLVRMGRADEARDVLTRGVAVAKQAGDLHTAEEMMGVLGTI